MSEFEGLTDAELVDLFMKSTTKNRLQGYRPYGHPDTYEDWFHLQNFGEIREWSGRPWQIDFHNAGSTYSQRLTMAANGVGKSIACSAETAIHATGRYPDWWDGKVFDDPVTIWIGSIDNSMQRIGPQALLMGGDLSENIGTGFIPAESIVRYTIRQAGIKDVVDTVVVRHESGGESHIVFLTFEQGWRKWQAGAPNVIQMDEEPDENDLTQKDVFSEILTRLVRNSGILYCGYTPLLGETDLTRHFMYPKSDGVWYTSAGWDDAPHMKEEDKRQLRAQYRDHELQARTMGVPMMGEGRIFTIPEDEILVDSFKIPEHFACIEGIDFGINHPAAVVKLAWDRDNDVVYLCQEWRRENVETPVHAQAIKDMGGDFLPVAWPHDGAKRDPNSGIQFAKLYRDRYGVGGLLSRSARYDNKVGGAQPQWPIIEQMQERMGSGRFKVFRTCQKWLEEYRSYHTKDGKIVSRRDDLLKASFYALMDLRYARSAMPSRAKHSHMPGPSLSTRIT